MPKGDVVPSDFGLNPFAHEMITVADTAVGFTAGTMNPDGHRNKPCRKAYVTNEDQPLRYTVDGTTPTTIVGHEAKADVDFWVNGEEELKNFLAIRVGGSSAIISVTYYR